MLREVRSYFRTLQEEFPEIKYFAFGVDEQTLRERVSTFDDYYMFVDYGEFDSNRDDKNRLIDSWQLAVTVAQPLASRTLLPDEVDEYHLQSFEITARIRARMLEQQHSHPWLQYLSDNHGIAPFIAPEICRSVGHSILFQLKGLDLLSVKKRMP